MLTIHLYKNPISFIHIEAFNGLNSLRLLDLSGTICTEFFIAKNVNEVINYITRIKSGECLSIKEFLDENEELRAKIENLEKIIKENSLKNQISYDNYTLSSNIVIGLISGCLILTAVIIIMSLIIRRLIIVRRTDTHEIKMIQVLNNAICEEILARNNCGDGDNKMTYRNLTL